MCGGENPPNIYESVLSELVSWEDLINGWALIWKCYSSRYRSTFARRSIDTIGGHVRHRRQEVSPVWFGIVWSECVGCLWRPCFLLSSNYNSSQKKIIPWQWSRYFSNKSTTSWAYFAITNPQSFLWCASLQIFYDYSHSSASLKLAASSSFRKRKFSQQADEKRTDWRLLIPLADCTIASQQICLRCASRQIANRQIWND